MLVSAFAQKNQLNSNEQTSSECGLCVRLNALLITTVCIKVLRWSGVKGRLWWQLPEYREREKKRASSTAIELCYSSALPTWFWIGFSLVFRVWRGQRGRLVVFRERIEIFWQRSWFNLWLFSGWMTARICVYVSPIMCVFVDIFNLMDTRHTLRAGY